MRTALRTQARAAARAVLRPLWLIVWRRIEARIRAMPQQGAVGGSLPALSAEAAWHQHMPAFLNAVSTVGAFGHELARHKRETKAALDEQRERIETLFDLHDEIVALSSQLRDLATRVAALEAQAQTGPAVLESRIADTAARIEFVRREILFELKYGPPPASSSAASSPAPSPAPGPTPGPLPAQIQPRILSAEKVAAMRERGLRVNLGCGHIPLDGYINVDMRALPGVDIVAEAGNLPFEPASLTELRSAHLLEHFPQEELRRRLLPYWHSLLAPGGSFVAVVPDGEAMVSHLAAGTYAFEQFREVLFGAQDYAGDFHYNLFEPASLHALLEEAGFTGVELPVRARRNGACYELEIRARKP